MAATKTSFRTVRMAAETIGPVDSRVTSAVDVAGDPQRYIAVVS